LVEPGDFPHAGAHFYRGYPVGVSALLEESDVWVGERTVDEIIDLRGRAGRRAVTASKAHVPGWKLLNGDPSKLLVPESLDERIIITETEGRLRGAWVGRD
jgi:hypothetical protein